jgi:hypothetical protein
MTGTHDKFRARGSAMPTIASVEPAVDLAYY